MILSAVLMFLVQGASADVPILRFHEVSSGIYRGARPDAAGLAALAKIGVKTDLNLDNDMAAASLEATTARTLGINYIGQPMSGFWSPDNAQVERILAIVADPNNQPIFIHCLHGQDRTGLIVGLHRVFHEGVDPAVAYGEMLELGFHPELFFLNHFYEEKTGFED